MNTAAASAGTNTCTPPPRRARRHASSEAGPVIPLPIDNPLRLTQTMRGRLLAAVQALVSASRMSDAARLATVVLTAKARASAGYSTSIWAAELGCWLGVSQSTVAHTVLPELRRAGVLGSRVTTNSAGHTTGLECWIVPMYQAQQTRHRQHPLALSRTELAVLLRLCESLFGPGWSPKDRAPTPPGLLAGRRGRGAATDRLGLLLMVLSSNSKGWLRLCPGTVDTGRGRPAATVARMLGCSPATAAKVLSRLQRHGVTESVRQQTASGLHGKARLRVVPVAEAYARSARGVRQTADALVSDLPATASGDLEGPGEFNALAATGLSGKPGSLGGKGADLAAAAHHHALHASVASAVDPVALSLGFSGEGRGGFCGLPDRAGSREDQARDARARGPLTLVTGEAGPLRGDKPKKSVPLGKLPEELRTSPAAARRATPGARQRGTVAPPPEDLKIALAPVRQLWARLDRPYARDLITGAVRDELAKAAGYAGRAAADDVLADRLSRRLLAQGGPLAVIDPVGWLISRGLPQRPGCSDVRCDERLRLDTGDKCATCTYLIDDRRAQRRRIAAAVDAELPDVDESDRRMETERRLHQVTTAAAWAKRQQREQLEVERAKHLPATAEKGTAPAVNVLDEPLNERAHTFLPAPALPGTLDAADEYDEETPLILEDLSRDQVLDWRARAAKDHQIVVDHITQYGEFSARRLFTNSFVDQVHRLQKARHLVLAHTTWGHT